MQLQGRTALITGAAGGIGRALALALAEAGMHLVLADIDEAGLAAFAQLVARPGARVTAHRLDVADRDAVMALPAAVEAAHGGLDLLVNNAGVALGGTFEQVAETDFDWLMAVNFFGTVRMTRAFLPLLHRAGEARIVNLSSIFGIIAPPGQAAYCASKFAVRGFSEALRRELAGTGVGITTVHPGGVATAIARSARMPALAPAASAAEMERARAQFSAALRMPPTRAAKLIVAAVRADRARAVIGTDAKIAALLERLAPVGYWSMLRRLGGRALRHEAPGAGAEA